MDFKEKIINDLKEAGIDVHPNSIVDDLFIRKYLELNKPLDEKIEEYPKKLHFTNFENQDEEDMKGFAGNFFVETADGKKAKGPVRLFFDTPTDSFISEGTIFSTDDGKEYITVSDNEITEGDMVNNSSGMYYYQEVTVEATEVGKEYNAEPGEINSCSNPVITGRVVKIENPYKFNSGSNPETPQELYNRVKDSLSVRNLTNNPAINSILKNNFKSIIKELFTVRTGHKHMERDIVMIDGDPYRVGNKFDIWTDTSDLAEYTLTIDKTSADPEVNFGFSIGDLGEEIGEKGHSYTAKDTEGNPIEQVPSMITEVRQKSGSGSLSEPISGVEFIQNPGHKNSIRQKSKLDFTNATLDGTSYADAVSEFQIKFLSSGSIDRIQEFVNDDKNRLPVADPLIKHFEILPLYGIIYYKGDIEESEMQEGLTNFLNNYHFNPERAQQEFSEGGDLKKILELSDLVGKMIELGAKKVKMNNIDLKIDLPDGTTDTINDEYKIDPFQTILPQVSVAKE